MSIDKQKVSAAAQRFINKGAYDKAIRELRKIVDADPDDDRTLLKIGNLHHRKGDTQAAVDIYLEVAELYRETGFKQKAVAVYKQVLQLQPERLDVSESLAGLLQAQGLTRDALTQYRELLERYRAENDDAACERVLASMCRIDPENVGARVKYAEQLARRQKVEAALKQFHFAAQLLRDENRLRDYLKVADRILLHSPNDEAILKESVKVYLEDNQARQALAKLQKLYSLNPNDSETLELLAEAFVSLKQDIKAVSVLKELARHYEQSEGDDEKALRTWRRAYALDPDDAEIHLALQMANEDSADIPMLGDSAVVAVELLEDAIEPLDEGPRVRRPHSIHGNDPQEEIERLLAECDACLGYNLVEKAREHVEHVFSLDPNNTEAYVRLVLILEQQGQLQEAARILRELAQQTWEKDKDLALDMVHKARRYDPNNPANFQVVLGFGLDPTSFGFPAPQAAPQPQQSTRRPPPPPIPAGAQRPKEAVLLNNWGNNASQSNLPPVPPPSHGSLPSSTFEDDAPTPPSGPPALADQMLNYPSELSFDEDMESLFREQDEAPLEEEESFSNLFDIDDDDEDFDELFSDDMMGAFIPQASGDLIVARVDTANEDPTPAGALLSERDLQIVSADIDELDFYLAQGLLTEANQMVSSLLARYGEHPMILAAQARLRARSA